MSRSWIWLDVKILPENRAFIPVSDPGLLHGRGLFETLRAYDGIPFRLADHLTRMRRSAKHFKIQAKIPVLDRVIPELCGRNRLPNASIRITLTYGGHLFVTSRKLRLPVRSWYRNGCEVMIAPWRRDPNAPLAGHKTLNYLENILTYQEARKRGCADALYVGQRNRLFEGCVSNIFLVTREQIVTPSLGQNILPGVTRKVVMEIARVKERVVRLREFWNANEVFLTNSLIEVLPVRPGPVTVEIAKFYKQAVRQAVGRSVSGTASQGR